MTKFKLIMYTACITALIEIIYVSHLNGEFLQPNTSMNIPKVY